MEKFDKQNVQDIFALTPLQKGILFHYLKEPGSAIYLEQLSLKLSGRIDRIIFEQAWNDVIQANPMMRAVFRWEKLDHPIQIILKKWPLHPQYHDFSNQDAGSLKDCLEQVKVKDRHEAFDLRQVPFRVMLCDLGANNYQMIISNHHILYDGWSNGIIMREFFEAYNDLLHKRIPSARNKSLFKEYVRWLGNRDRNAQEGFWKDYFKGFEGAGALSIKNRTDDGDGEIEHINISLFKESKPRLESFCKTLNITLASLLNCAWGILLQKYNNSSDIVFGTSVAGRSAKIKGIEEVVGLFINTLPLRITQLQGETTAAFLQRINGALLSRDEFETTALVDIKEFSDIPGIDELFDTLVTIENYPLDTELFKIGDNLTVQSYSLEENSHYDLSLVIEMFDEIEVNLKYNSNLFESDAIAALSCHFWQIVMSILENPNLKVGDLDMLSVQEKRQLLYDFNDTFVQYPTDRTVSHLFGEQAERSPDSIALKVSRKDTESRRYTFRELNDKSNRLARLLQSKGVKTCTIVGIMLERSLEMVVGLLAILKAGGTYLPIDPAYPGARIRLLLEGSDASLVLTSSDVVQQESIRFLAAGQSPVFQSLLVDELASDLAVQSVENVEPVGSASDLIYIIFTSGSTGKPKGAGIYHRGFTNLVNWFVNEFGLNNHDSTLIITSLSFDLTQKFLYAPLITGGTLCLPETNYFDPLPLLRNIQEEAVTWLGCTPGMFYRLVEQEESVSEKRLSNLRYAFLGGEPVSIMPLLSWLESPECRAEIVNTYGPTECTDICGFYRIVEPRRFLNLAVPIGQPVYNACLHILDKHRKLVPIGVAGELMIGGIGVGIGYIKDKELTASKFIAHSFEAGQKVQVLYRTGDLARRWPDGNIEFLGRIDHQVKVRGFRIEIGEIETQLSAHDSVKETVVMALETNNGDKSLCAYIVPRKAGEFNENSVRDSLLEQLPDYMVPAHFVLLDKLPLNPHGKVDRKALPAPGIIAEAEYVPPANPIEFKLVRMWGDVLGVRHESISVNDNFFHLGGHSLKAVTLVSRIHKEFSVEVSIMEFFKIPTIRGIVGIIKQSGPTLYTAIQGVEKRSHYALSSAQKRLYFLQQMDPVSIAYNISVAFILEGDLNENKLTSTFQRLVQRHESFRTSFHRLGEEAVQRVHDDVEMELEYYYPSISAASLLYEDSYTGLLNNFFRPFDLSVAPLLRVGLIKIDTCKHILVVDMHHIVADGVSTAILVKEFVSLYTDRVVSPLKSQYKDYAQWQNRREAESITANQSEFWERQFHEEVPILNLPTDFVRPLVKSFAGASIQFQLRSDVYGAIQKCALENNVTLYIILASVYYIFLSKLSSQEDIVIGTPTAGRNREELEGIIGMFVNTLALRAHPNGEKRFDQFLGEVKTNILNAFENQDYQFESLIESVLVNRDTSRNPLFDTMFLLQNMDSEELEIPGLNMRPIDYDFGTAKFDLTLTCAQSKENLNCTFEYSTDLFQEETIKRFINYFNVLLANLLDSGDCLLKDVEILPREEKKRILFDFNDSRRTFDGEKNIDRLFADQVERSPEKIALKVSRKDAESQGYTYLELNEKSNRLARLLQSEGVKTGTVVGIMLERSFEMIVGLLAILKAGGTYLPIDPAYPGNRVRIMLEGGDASIVLTTGAVVRKESIRSLGTGQDRVFQPLLVDEMASELAAQSTVNLTPVNSPDDLIYIIFTSGSTGRPKGAGVYHRGFSNLVNWFVNEFRLDDHDSTLIVTSLSFDLTQKFIYAPLITGGTLCLPETNYFDPPPLMRNIQDEAVTWLGCTPGMFYRLVGHGERGEEKRLSNLRYVFLGGEPISITPLLPWLESPGCHAEIVNTYGPTECTDICGFYRIREPHKFLNRSVPIGQPVHNVHLHILDKYRNLVPIGVAGELMIGGAGVGIGYIKDKELTASKFIEHTFEEGQAKQLIYRTGDLARRWPDGNIEFLGRLDHQVKIRGFRIEIGEIESQLTAHDSVKEAVVLALEAHGEEKSLCAYIVPAGSTHFSENSVRDSLREQLPDYMVPAYFILLDKLPLNAHGKVDRKALPAPDITASDDYVAPAGPVELKQVSLWAEVLGLEEGIISATDNFFQLGGHSLKAVMLISRIHKEFSVEVPIMEFFKTPTIRGIAGFIRKSRVMETKAIEEIEQREYYALSSSQKRLYVLQQMDLDSTAYHMPRLLPLSSAVDIEKLEDSFFHLIQRHESFRTSFHLYQDQPVQRVHQGVSFKLEYHEVGEEFESPQLRTFDLSQAPLLRAGVYKTPSGKYLLFLDTHHIIMDATSEDILIRECIAFYSNQRLEPLNFQYKDYSQWQNNTRLNEYHMEQELYWLNLFSGEIPVLNLPFDYPRPPVQRYEGSEESFTLSLEVTRGLERLAREIGGTLYMVLLAVYTLFLSKLSSQEDIVVGSPIAGRMNVDFENIIGMFANTLALRNYPSGTKTLKQFLQDVKTHTLEAFANQEYQFEDLVDKLGVRRDISRNPIFDTMFSLLAPVDYSDALAQIIEPQTGGKENAHKQITAKFDLTLTCVQSDRNLQCHFEYSTDLFKRESILRFIDYFKILSAEVLRNCDRQLKDIEILPAKEKQRILFDFNDSHRAFDREKTIDRLFADQVERSPENIAFKVGRKDAESQGYTYQELNEKSNRLARLLQSEGIKTGTVVGIMLERSFEMIVGLLAILKAGGTYLPIDPAYPGNRIRLMLEGGDVSIVLTTGAVVRQDSIRSLGTGQDRVFQPLLVDELTNELAAQSAENLNPVNVADDLIYIIFTSGSTGKPKGAGVYHRGFSNLVNWFVNEFELDDHDSTLIVTSLSFDLTQKFIYAPLITGGTLCLPETNYFDPPPLMRDIQKEAVTWLGCTPQMFYHLVGHGESGKEERLSSLRYVFLGGEPISITPLLPWLESAGCHAEIVNTYGPTECTDICGFYRIREPREFLNRSVPIGQPVYNVHLHILDKHRKLVPIGVAGELMIGGAGVGIGYIKDKELTAGKFIEHAFEAGQAKQLIYRTGDLARRWPDGNIEFLGRLDHQVKIRGFRIEIGEIESQLKVHHSVKEVVVVALEVRGEEKSLCAYIVPADNAEFKENKVRDALLEQLPDYMVPSYFVLLEKLPLNAHGKVDRKALPEPNVTPGDRYVPPDNPLEFQLVCLWSEVLGLDAGIIGIQTNFFQLGGHSLKAVMLMSRIQKQFSVDVPIIEFFKAPTIRGLYNCIQDMGVSSSKLASIEVEHEREFYELSSPQKRLFILQQMELTSTAYNMPRLLPLSPGVDIDRLEKSFRQLILRHESFRTSFHMHQDQPVQKIHDHVPFEIEEHNVGCEFERPALRPFDLSVAPLLRVGLVKTSTGKYLLFLDTHHIIMDATSEEILIHDFIALYSGETLPPLPFQYKDYAHWQNRADQNDRHKKQEIYWLKRFPGEIPVLDLPLDFPRPSELSFKGSEEQFELTFEESRALEHLARDTGGTLYIVLIAVYNLFLSKLSGQEDLVVGSPVSGRLNMDFECIIGMFANTLALRNYPSPQKNFKEFLLEVKENTLEAFANQEYPFEELVDKLGVQRDTSRNPIFDAVFNLLSPTDYSERLAQILGDDAGNKKNLHKQITAKFDLTLTCVQSDGGVRCVFEYSTDLFRQETILRFIYYFKKIITAIIADPGVNISVLDILSREEKQRLLYEFNMARKGETPLKTVPQMFREQAQKSQDNIALVEVATDSAVNDSTFTQRKISYIELNEKSNRLAQYLIRLGVKEADRVALMVERSAAWIIGMLAIMKAGATYVPVNYKDPLERKIYILEECGIEVLLTRAEMLPGDDSFAKYKCVLEYDHYPNQSAADFELTQAHPEENFAYIIFTSGSTGRPKGVPITHSNIVPLLYWRFRDDMMGKCNRVLQHPSFHFDWSMQDILNTLTSGAALYLTPDEILLNPEVCVEFINENAINGLYVTPTKWQYLLGVGQPMDSLNYLFIGAERLSRDLASRTFRMVSDQCRVFNLYGPTETTIVAATHELTRTDVEKNKHLSSIPIGRSIRNLQLFILDKNMNLCPMNTVGQLYISGAGVARGYLNRPELTVEKFVPNPFFEHTDPYSYPTMYSTGDVSRWVLDGRIEFLGRVDHQIKIRGHRIELGEIENRLLSYPPVKEAVVLVHGNDNEDMKICAYIVARDNDSGPIGIDDLKEHLEQRLPFYMVPSHYFQLPQLPYGPTGKVDRKALPEPVLDGTERSYVAPVSETQKELAGIWAELLDQDVHCIGLHDNFFQLGGHSLKATVLASKIHKHFNRKFELAEIFKNPTIGELSVKLEHVNQKRFNGIPLAEKRTYYPASSAQKRLYILQRMALESTAYNLPRLLPLASNVDIERLESCFRHLIQRHESFRTSFHLIGDEPVQKIVDYVPFEMEYHEIEHPDQIAGPRCFDLSKAPLLRIGLIKKPDRRYLLQLDMHHIIMDGVSEEILIHDFVALYSGETLEPLHLQYKDFSQWQHSTGQKEMQEEQEKYWINQFSGEIPVLDLPLDFPRPSVQRFEGMVENFSLNQEESGALETQAREIGGTLYMVMLAHYTLFLSKLSGQEDIVVGSPIAGRRNADLGYIIGMFVNTLAMRNRPLADKSFKAFLAEVKALTLEAFDNQDYPFEDLVDHIAVQRDTARNPIFDVMLSLLAPPDYAAGLGEIIEQQHGAQLNVHEQITAKFDLTLTCVQSKEDLLCTFEYNTNLFKKETIQRFINYFRVMLKDISRNSDRQLKDIEILPREEKQRILFAFNDSARAFDNEKTIPQMFTEQVERTPANIALKISTREAGSRVYTYLELNEESNRLARVLQSEGVKTGTIVGIMLERSLEMIVGLLAILKSGGTYLPIDPQLPENRIRLMLEAINASILLTTDAIYRRKSLNSSGGSYETVVQPLLIDRSTDRLEAHSVDNIAPASGADDLIYIIFTSGSTGKPKGAGVYHRGFTNLVNWFVSEFGLDEHDSTLMVTSLSFDMTQKFLYAPLIIGGALCLPETHYFDPLPLTRNIQEEKVTWLGCTPSMFYQLVDKEENSEEKRLSDLRYIFLGGEPISITPLLSWLESAECHAEIVNTYGPTECTDICSFYRIREPRQFLTRAVPIGQPVYNARLHILDKHRKLVPIGVAGEVVIGGIGVGIGYIKDEELTASKFFSHSFEFGQEAQVFYRTGDLARRWPDGNIEFLGRLDHQVKVRGFRIEIGEIEAQLITHDNIKDTIVVARETNNGDKFLCAYIVPRDAGDFNENSVRDALLEQLPDYMVPAYFVLLDKMPLNANGKIDRKCLPEPGLKAGKDYVAPAGSVEIELVPLWADVLGIKEGFIGVHDNFFQLGGHSLKAVTLAGRIHKEFSVEVPIMEFFKIPTIRAMATYIQQSGKEDYTAIPVVEKREYYPLSSSQKRLYILQQMAHDSTAYNMPRHLPLTSEIDRDKLTSCFRQLIQRHESFRTSFHMIGDEPVQLIHDEVAFEVEYHKLEQGASISGPIFFDLSRPPLLRAGLIKTANGEWILQLDMHHIIMDGISENILIRDFAALYTGDILPTLSLQYKDYVNWQHSPVQKKLLGQQENYWMTVFAEEVAPIDLPADYLRTPGQEFAGDTLGFEIDAHTNRVLKKLALDHGMSIFMILLALYNILLSKLSSREDIVIGTPVAGRRHAELQEIIGVFINTLALRNYPGGFKSFNEFLQEIKESTLSAFHNQDYPFEELVEKLDIHRDISRNPLFDIMFVFQNMEAAEINLPQFSFKPNRFETGTAKFDLTLSAIERDEKVLFSFNYSTKLFSSSTIKRFISYFKNIISVVLKPGDLKISDLDIISEAEKREILYDFNDTRAHYSKEKTIHQLFDEQVEKSPDRIAVVAKKPLTYRELNEKSRHLASRLRAKGVTAGSVVALMTERLEEAVIGIFAILKAGGAYLPIDPGYPVNRIRFILQDSDTGILLTQLCADDDARFRDLLSSFGDEKILSISDEILKPAPTADQALSSQSETIEPAQENAYIIYTSGTTGTPKGVIITHRSVVNLVTGLNKKIYKDVPPVNIALLAPFVFDASIKQIFPAFLLGHTLFIVPETSRLNGEALLRFYRENHIWCSDATPAHLSIMLNYREELGDHFPVQRLVVGGQELDINRCKQFFSSVNNDHFQLINVYGPTECCDIATLFTVTPVAFKQYQRIPIGKPIGNAAVYILGPYGEIRPVGVPGELCIAGDGVGKGYVNRPGLTAEKFTPMPLLNVHGAEALRIYHSGDLARWLADGNIEFLGRIDDQIKIRGFRVELAEIERQLSSHPDVKNCVVKAWGSAVEGEILCAYIVPAKDLKASELKEYLAAYLPDYMVPSSFMMLANLPLTASGKIDRRALPEPEKGSDGDVYIAPRDNVEKVLVSLWAEILNIPPHRVGIDDDFFHLGGHSLKATVMLAKIHKVFSKKITLVDIFNTPTIRNIAKGIRKNADNRYTPITHAEIRPHYPLSSAQKQLFVLQQMDLESTGYNIPLTVILAGELDKNRLTQCFKTLIRRHESLRTSFHMQDGEPRQKIHDTVEFVIHEETVPGDDYPDISACIRPFDLSRAPLLRVKLINRTEQEHLLIVDMHHIITDGISMNIFVKEIIAIYAGEQLLPLEFQYKDYSQWQAGALWQEKIKSQGEFWLNRFQGEIPVLNLPLDFTRPAIQSFAGSLKTFEVPASYFQPFKELNQRTGTTTYMLLLAIFNVFLSKLNGQDDIVVGVDVAGRPAVELHDIIGMFINTLALRNAPCGEKTFIAFLEEVKETTLQAFDNQDYSFDRLVMELGIGRVANRNPLFDVMFSFQNIEDRKIASGLSINDKSASNLEFKKYTYDNKTSKFDLTLSVTETASDLSFCFEYNTALFRAETIEGFVNYFKKIFASIINDPGQKISHIEVVDREAKKALFDSIKDEIGISDIENFVMENEPSEAEEVEFDF